MVESKNAQQLWEIMNNAICCATKMKNGKYLRETQ